MPTPVRALYVAALVILMVAGAVVSARTTLPTTAPATCASLPEAAVAAVAPAAAGVAVPAPSPQPDGDQLVRVLGDDEDPIIELRCRRVTGSQADQLVSRTAETETDDASETRRLEVPGTGAVVVRSRGRGLVVEQPDPDADVLRIWFLRGAPPDAVVVAVVRATRVHQAAQDTEVATETG